MTETPTIASEEMSEKDIKMTPSKTNSLKSLAPKSPSSKGVAAQLKKRSRVSARQALLPLPKQSRPSQSDQSKLIFQMKSELRRLQLRDKEWKAMFQMLSHDLKEPILTLEGFSKLLGETKLDKDQTRYLNVVRDAVNLLHQLVGSLQSVAKLSQDPQELIDLSLNELLHSVTLNLSNHFERTQGAIALPVTDIILRSDPIRLFQIFMNLIANSLKYHKKNDPPRIMVTHRKTVEGIRIYISDNGIGMTPKELEQLFVPFTRLNHVKSEGMGLGLSIVKRIAESLGGSISVKSKSGQGTTFCLLFPKNPDSLKFGEDSHG